jgi:hypothetical protein
MERVQRILIIAGIAVLLVMIFFLIASAITRFTGYVVINPETSDIDSCLKRQEIILYINSLNSAAALKEIKLINYLHENIKIINCMRNYQACLENEIDIFPTWVINNGKINKDITYEELIEYSGCGTNK